MGEIVLRPSSILLRGYGPGMSPALEKALGVWDKALHRHSWRAMLKLEEGMTIPRGFSLDWLQKLLRGWEVSRAEPFPWRPVSYKVLSPPRNSRQQDALSFLMGEGDRFRFSADRSQKLLCLATGDGKTYISIAHAARLGRATIVFSDRSSKIQEWVEQELLVLTDLRPEDVLVLAGSPSVRKAMASEANHKVYVASHRTLAAWSESGGPGMIDGLFKHLGIGLKIYDEAHVEWRNIFLTDCASDVAETVYMTATPGRSNREEDKVYQRMFEETPQFGMELRYREEDSYHTVVMVEFDTRPPLEVQAYMATHNRRGFDVNGWCNWTEERAWPALSGAVWGVLDQVFRGKPGAKVAVVLHTKKLVEMMQEAIMGRYPGKPVGVLTGDTPAKDRDAVKACQVIVTTEKSFGKAVNVLDLEALVNTVPMSSAIITEQILGRLREIEGKRHTVFFDMTDMGFSDCREQQKARAKLLSNKAKTFLRLDLR